MSDRSMSEAAMPPRSMPGRPPTTAAEVHGQTGSDRMARRLGILSLALGALEVAGAGPLARMLGIRGQESFIRACGAREIMQGVAILGSKDPTPWIWVRVAGDMLDIGTLVMEHYAAEPGKRHNVTLALGSVLGITALDVMNARQLSAENRRPWSNEIDFSTRSGFPGGAAQARHGRSRAEARAAQPAEAM